MKNFLLIALASFTCTFSFAKKVKFTVDMTGQTIDATGMHIMGDFQTLAGFPGGDWMPNSTPLMQEGTSDIYSIVVDIPAFAKYEYKFLNGDQGYNAEFVPDESRVGYNFNDNRWIWVDSLANDTTDVGAILFAGNAPAGLTLLRFKVDVHEQPSLNTEGIHVAGNFQGWDPSKIMLYSFGAGIYEIISYLPAGIYQFRYYNGNTTGDAENVPLACAVVTNREVELNTDTILNDYTTGYPVCFSGCSACLTAGIEETNSAPMSIYPNPAKNHFTIRNADFVISHLEIFDVLGNKVHQASNMHSSAFADVSELHPGIYFLRIYDADKTHSAFSKLIIE